VTIYGYYLFYFVIWLNLLLKLFLINFDNSVTWKTWCWFVCFKNSILIPAHFTCVLPNSANINWRDVQRKNVVNNVDMSSLRASWQNGPYTANTQNNPKTRRTIRRNRHSEKNIVCVFRINTYMPNCGLCLYTNQPCLDTCFKNAILGNTAVDCIV